MAMRRSPKNNLKRSPIKSGFVKKFQKIRDDKAKQLIKNSKLMLRGFNKGQGHVGNRSYVNKSARKNLKSPKAVKRIRNARALRNNRTNESQTKECAGKPAPKDMSDSDDDCIIVENSQSHVSIADDDADAGYQSLFQSFTHRVSSTPCATKAQSKLKSRNGNSSTSGTNIEPKLNSNHIINSSLLSSNQYSPSYANVVSDKQNGMQPSSPQANAQYFLDVSGKVRLGSADYNLVAPLKDKLNDDTIVIVDETTINDKDATLEKHKTNESSESSSESSSSESSSEEEEEDEVDSEEGELKESGVVDDSVVFVSETNTNDFISINSANAGNFRNTPVPAAPKRAPMYSELFTRTEQKQLEAYNTNAYNPNAGQVFTSKKRMVIIDGSNVAFKHSLDKGFSVKGLKIAIDYFERMGHEVKAVIPQFRMNNYKSTDPQELNNLHKSGKIVQTPCKNLPGLTSTSYDDRFILQLASELDAAVVSNDNYRDLLHENPAFKKIIETRVIGYTWCNDIFILPKDPYGKWGPTLDMILNRS